MGTLAFELVASMRWVDGSMKVKIYSFDVCIVAGGWECKCFYTVGGGEYPYSARAFGRWWWLAVWRSCRKARRDARKLLSIGGGHVA